MNPCRAWVLLVPLVILSSGCNGAEEFPQEEPEVADTTGAFQGLSPAEIRDRAEPMSPEMAESLGIVDTTIHIESPTPDDTLIPPVVRDTFQ